jgi:hypothetical protein
MANTVNDKAVTIGGRPIYTISNDTSLAENSDEYLATQKAVKAYVDGLTGGGGSGDLAAANIDVGASGTAGTLDIFPATASKGKLQITCTNQTGDTTVTLNANAMGQATAMNIPDPGAAAAYFALSTAALTLAEVDVLDGAIPGTIVANKAIVVGSDGKCGALAFDGLVTAEAGLAISADQNLALGSGATAATKITMEFDATTTGIGLLQMGSTAAPMVLAANPGSSVIAQTVNILHSAGAGDCDDLIASYNKVNVIGDGDSGITVVGHASRAYVGLTGGSNNSVASQAYGSQPWAKHEGTGAITAMSALSAKLDVSADNFTATTINAGHFHIEGAATVTGQFDGVMIEVYPDVTCLDSALAIAADSTATVAAGIRMTGTITSAFSFANGSGVTHGGAAAAAVQGYITVSVAGNPYRVPYLANSDS